MRKLRGLRYTEGTLLALVALNALGGGIYGMAGAEGLPNEVLSGTTFSDYRIPSLILVVVVGGSSMLAALAVFGGHRSGRFAALGAGCVLLGWMIAQLSLIGYLSWLQPTFVVVAFVVIILGAMLPSARQASS